MLFFIIINGIILIIYLNKYNQAKKNLNNHTIIINKNFNINFLDINLNNFSINSNNEKKEINNEKKDKNKNKTIETVEDFEFACINKSATEIAQLYYETCSNGILLDKNKYKLVEIPKISIIIPIYNREKFILRILRSIQNQSMKDFEIIFVDDFSTDSSVNLIKTYQKEDERIILIEHPKNEGTLIARNDGVIKAKGEYLLFADSDDLLLPNILKASYEIASKENYEIILFGIFKRTLEGRYYIYNIFREEKAIYQPELSSFMYYGLNYLKQIDFHLVGKLIRKEVFIKTINSISDYYIKNHMNVNEDGLMNFMLLKKANSLKYINFYGYMYNTNPSSVILTLNNDIDKTIRDYFLYLKYMIEYTDNNFHEKSMAEEQLRYVFKHFRNKMKYVTKNFQLLYNILNLYLNCTYISEDGKNKSKIMNEKIKLADNNTKILNNTY